FDLLTFRMTSILEVTDDSGVKKSLTCNERYYAPSEISWLLASLGFQKIEICGCAPGQFNKNKMLTPNDYEMLVLPTFSSDCPSPVAEERIAVMRIRGQAPVTVGPPAQD